FIALSVLRLYTLSLHDALPIYVVRRDARRQRPFVTADRFPLVVRQPDHALELVDAADPVTVLPSPIVPLRALDGGKEALAECVGPRTDHETRTRHGGESRCGVRIVIGKGSGFGNGSVTFGERRT